MEHQRQIWREREGEQKRRGRAKFSASADILATLEMEKEGITRRANHDKVSLIIKREREKTCSIKTQMLPMRQQAS